MTVMKMRLTACVPVTAGERNRRYIRRNVADMITTRTIMTGMPMTIRIMWIPDMKVMEEEAMTDKRDGDLEEEAPKQEPRLPEADRRDITRGIAAREETNIKRKSPFFGLSSLYC